ncbi:MAG: hypothetical protein RLZZ618_1954 [Pseudomonadota bacterium]|jgi:hypothetical protein
MAPVWAVLAACLLSGCADRGLYQWGTYDTLLYESYKHPERTAALRQGLEDHIALLESTMLQVAPGLYAELGTLYLQSNDSVTARRFYVKERQAWPESRVLMDALIARIDARPRKAEVKP